MKRIIFEASAFEDLNDWAIYDKARFIKIHDLIKAMLRDPF